MPLLARDDTTRTWTKRPWPLTRCREASEPTLVRAEDVDIERMVGLKTGQSDLLGGDFFNMTAALYPQAWMGALIGCPVYASGYGCVAKPTGQRLDDLLRDFSVERALESDWMGVLDGVLGRAKRMAGAAYPVQQLHLRGFVDMLAAVLGEQELCLALIDRPADVRTLADRFADLLIATAKRGIELRGSWNRGYLCRWGIYAPGPMLDYQAGASTILSPKLYEQVLVDAERKVFEAFRYTFIHLHAAGVHVVEPLLKIDDLGAFQINLDRETGVWEKERILETARAIQAAGKCVLIDGELSERELEEFLERLSPGGLAVRSWPPAGRMISTRRQP